jgi:hypothetical protein
MYRLSRVSREMYVYAIQNFKKMIESKEKDEEEEEEEEREIGNGRYHHHHHRQQSSETSFFDGSFSSQVEDQEWSFEDDVQWYVAWSLGKAKV